MTQHPRKEFALHTFSERPLQLIADDDVYEKPLQLSFRADDDSRFELRERERWVLLKIPRCDIDGVGEVKCP